MRMVAAMFISISSVVWLICVYAGIKFLGAVVQWYTNGESC